MKKILALLMAITMLLALSATAMADEPGVETDPTGTGEWEGGGSGLIPEFRDTEKIRVIVPTSAAFNFILDPQGIYGMDPAAIAELVVDENSNRLGTLEDGIFTPLEGAGRIIFPDAHKPIILNESNRDIAVTFNFKIEVTHGETINADEDIGNVAVVGKQDEVEKEDDSGGVTPVPANIFIGATFSEENVDTTTPIRFKGDRTLPFATAPKTPAFVFGEADYLDRIDVVGDPSNGGSVTVHRNDVLQDGTGNGTQFILVGWCNPHADWAALNITADEGVGNTNIEITVGYSYAVATETETDALISDGSPIPGLTNLHSITAASFETIPSDIPFNTEEERDVIFATETADRAAAKAIEDAAALDALITAHGVANGEEKETALAAIDTSIKPSGEAALALIAAEEALDIAETAFAIADAFEAEEVSPEVLADLQEAIDALIEAINGLKDKIAEAQALFNTEDELAAIEATGNAAGAKTAVDTAISELQGLISAADGNKADPTHGTMLALRHSLDTGDAFVALGTAKDALETANTALTKAQFDDSEEPFTKLDIIPNLQTAINILSEAIQALEDRMAEGNALFPLTFSAEVLSLTSVRLTIDIPGNPPFDFPALTTGNFQMRRVNPTNNEWGGQFGNGAAAPTRFDASTITVPLLTAWSPTGWPAIEIRIPTGSLNQFHFVRIDKSGEANAFDSADITVTYHTGPSSLLSGAYEPLDTP